MSTKAGTLEAPRGWALGPKEWAAMAIVALLAVAALIMSVLALQQRTVGTSVAQHPAGAGGAIERIYERSEPVTGTGSGLVTVADASILRGIYERSAPVTGTGPDLAEVGAQAKASLIYRRSEPVTGTGPGLTHLGDHS